MDQETIDKIALMPNVSAVRWHSLSGDPAVQGENWTVIFYEDADSQAVPVNSIVAIRDILPPWAECEICSTWERGVQMNIWIPEVRDAD
jgi:hypothetical protein